MTLSATDQRQLRGTAADGRLRTQLANLLLLSILLSPAVFRPSGSTQSGIRIDMVLAIAVACLFSPSALRIAASPARRFLFPLVMLPVLGAMSASLNTYGLDFSSQSAVAVVWGLVRPVVYLIAGWKLATRTTKAVGGLVPGLVSGAVATAAFGILQLRGVAWVDSLTSMSFNRATELGTVSLLQVNRRAFATFDGQPNTFGLFGVLVLAIALSQSIERRAAIALSVGGLVAVVTSQSRTALFLSTVVVVVRLIQTLPRRVRSIPLQAGLAAAILVAALNVYRGGAAIDPLVIYLALGTTGVVAITGLLGGRSRRPASIVGVAAIAIAAALSRSTLATVLGRNTERSNIENFGARTGLWNDGWARVIHNPAFGTIGEPPPIVDNGYLALGGMLGLSGLVIGAWLLVSFIRWAKQDNSRAGLAVAFSLGLVTTSAFISGRLSDAFWYLIGATSASWSPSFRARRSRI